MLVALQTIQVFLLYFSSHNENLSVTGQPVFAFLRGSKFFDLFNEGSTVLELPNETNATVGQWILLINGTIAK